MAQNLQQERPPVRTEIAHGLWIIKQETDHLKNYEFLDQMNTYRVSSAVNTIILIINHVLLLFFR